MVDRSVDGETEVSDEHLDAGLEWMELAWGTKAAEQALQDIAARPRFVAAAWAKKKLKERGTEEKHEV